MKSPTASICATAFLVTILSATVQIADADRFSLGNRPRLVLNPGKSLVLNRLRGGGIPSFSGLPIAEKSEPSSGTASIKLSLNYKVDGGVIVAVGPSSAFGNGDIHKAPKLQQKGGERWEAVVQVPLSDALVKYQYVVLSKTHRYEARIAERSVSLLGLSDGAKVDVQDAFRSPRPAVLATSCFTRAIFGRGLQAANVATENPAVPSDKLTWSAGAAGSDDVVFRFVVFAPRKEAGHSIWVTGKPAALGAWEPSKMVPMASLGSGLYAGQVTVARKDFPFEYKYAVLDAAGAEAAKEKDARKAALDGADPAAKFVVRDEAFNYPTGAFKAFGMAIPVSGIKTGDSTGIGEFLDLKKVVDWCTKTGLQLIQILPINDSGEDPSPYSASSSFALHPCYVRPSAVCDYYKSKFGTDMAGPAGWAKSLVEKLNGNWKIDHPKVLDEKRKIIDAIFDTVGQAKVLEDPEFQAWLQHSESWVKTYAAFKVQLGKEKNCNNKWFDATTWGKRATETATMVAPGGPDYGTVVRTYFVQYHLHLQLLEASKYAETHGIALKGDLPIGVTRCSSDVWAEPNLFKLDRNAGAPGNPEQNWGFPPYNWDQMHRDGCSWWRRRLAHMEQYFHAYRIDHVLGFFRMWEIPKNGGGGQYVPSGGLREQGLKNLRAIQTASNMLICGEDLGNVPPEVGPVLVELGICGLKIQRWCDGKTWEYPYLNVAASSCHDCSPCRLWWNENWGEAEAFFGRLIGPGQQCPGGPPDWVSQKIIKMHADTSALLSVCPIQDLVDMWGGLRSQNPKGDLINKPGSTDGCWIWRMHKSMEDLIKEDKYNDFVRNMLKSSNCGRVY
mmetsp:Transcript_55312/g.115704  ORF Transcript_55312/g.115704 Transcript_55312/m.115704 type:complete len:839 (-) Transcript_55312:278-2794(-)